MKGVRCQCATTALYERFRVTWGGGIFQTKLLSAMRFGIRRDTMEKTSESKDYP